MKALRIGLVTAIILSVLLMTSCGNNSTQTVNSETESSTKQYLHEPVFYTDSRVSVNEGIASFNGGVCSFSWNPNTWSYSINDKVFTISKRLDDFRIIEIKVLDQREGLVDDINNYCSLEIEKHFNVPLASQFIATCPNNGDDYFGIVKGFCFTFEDESSVFNTAISSVYAYAKNTGSTIISVTLYGEKEDINRLFSDLNENGNIHEGIIGFTDGILDTFVLK